MKKSKAYQKSNSGLQHPSYVRHNLANEELDRLTSFFSLLITIDQKNKKRAMKNDVNKK